MMPHNCLYVGFILVETKKSDCRNQEGNRSFSPRTRGMCFIGGYSSQVAPQRCPLRLTANRFNMSLSDSGCKSTAFF